MRKSLAVLVVSALVFMGCSGTDDDESDLGGGETTTTLPAWNPQPGQLPFEEPQQVPAQDGDVAVTLDVKARMITVSGQPLSATPFEATPAGGSTLTPKIDGPTIHVSPGGTITVTFKNDFTQNTNIHYHGLHVSPLDESDNVFRTFLPGTTHQSVVNLPANHPAGTYWYHVHYHGDSQLQVNGGLSGMLIVDGVEAVLPPQWQGIPQKQFALREVNTVGGAVLSQTGASNTVTTRLVNGILTPNLELVQNEAQLWRLAAIGPNLSYYLQFAGHQFIVVAEDGNPLFNGPAPPVTQLVMPPGKRYDVVLVASGTPGQYALTSTDSAPDVSNPPPPHTLVNVKVVPNAANAAAPDTGSITINAPDDGLREDWSDIVPAADRTFTFMLGIPDATTTTTAGATTTTTASAPVGVCPTPPTGSPPSGSHWMINGQVFDPNRLDVAVQINTYERWTLCNTSGAIHPFHIHVNEFEVLSVNGEKSVPQGTEDVVQIPAAYTNSAGQFVAGQVVIMNHFTDFNGWFVFHCHILAHEDNGMMQSIEVLLPGETPSPPPHDFGNTPHSRIKVG